MTNMAIDKSINQLIDESKQVNTSPQSQASNNNYH